MKHRFWIGFLGFGGVGALLLLSPLNAADLPVVTIGIVIDGPWERNDEILTQFQHEILEITRGEFDVRFPREKLIQADWTQPGVRSALDRLLADREVDLVVASGVLASSDVCRRGPLPKPVVAPFILDPAVQGIPLRNGTSGVPNLSYITFPADFKYALKIFQDVVPFRRMAVLSSQAIYEGIPELRSNLIKAAAETLDLTIEVIPVEQTVEPALAALPEDVEAVFVAPLLQLSPGEFDRLVSGLIERRLPSYSVVGTSEVKRGLLVGISQDFDIPRLARRLAVNVQRILLGEDPSSFSVMFSRGERLTINMATARAIGVSPSWGVLTEAELVRETRDVPRRLTLLKTIKEALTANLDLVAQGHFVESGVQGVNEARSVLLPQLDASGLGVVVDEDLASPFQSERSFSGSAKFRQLIYSHTAFKNFQVQKRLQLSRVAERDQVRLDIIQEAATAYLNLLRANTFEQIGKDNLKLTRSNLELARVRQSIGYSGPGEVYRWESQIATDRNSVIQANSQRNLAEISVNRVLHRPLEEPFQTEQVDTRMERYRSYMGDPGGFRFFRSFMADEGLAASPELKRLDAAIAAQKQVLRSANQAFWSPTITAEGEVTNFLTRAGAGSDQPALGGDRSWTLGINISLPIFSGGGRVATRRKAQEDLTRLRLEREAARERIEQRIRSAMHVMGASYAGIKLSRDAADAARRNRELLTDAYSRGTVSILALLDAQNAALVSEQRAANAVYDFLIDLIEAERAAGRFTLLMDAEEVAAFFGRLDAYRERADD